MKNTKGKEKIVIETKLNEYVPINDKICKLLNEDDQLNAIKFHGKPVKIFPRKNSKIEKIKEKTKIKVIFLL